MSPIDLTIFEQLKAGGRLPSPKGSALRIIRLTQQDDVSLNELAHAVKTDPVFSGRLIKAANGANRIGARPIVSILDAITVLGVPSVRALALGFSLISNHRRGNCANFDYARFWSHSLVNAIALQALSAAIHAAPAEEAFSIGLIFHIGELALATIFPEQYSEILQRLKDEPDTSLLDLEQASFMLTHNALSASMMVDWGFPKSSVDPVNFFATLDALPFEEGSRQFVLTHLLALSDYLGDICLAPPEQQRAMMPNLFLLGSRLALNADNLAVIFDKVTREWPEWGALLKINASQLPSFKELTQPQTSADAAQDARSKLAEVKPRFRILIIAGEDSLRGQLRTLFMNDGHEVFEATNGQEGFEMALELQPQIMLVDRLVPGMNGIELTQSLREAKIGRAIYILMLTRSDEDNKLIEALECGADDFMTLPLKPRMLAARVRAAKRIVMLQQEVERDREEIRRFAAELGVTNRRLQEVALTDSLTGYPNRRYAMDRIQQEWTAGSRNKRPLSVMVIDVDEFKSINDTFGHDVGDSVLKQVAAALKSGLRGQDVVCRIGGDEFLVISPDTSLEAAVACAERVRHAVHATPFVDGQLKLQGSISIGVAVRDDTMKDIDALIKCADRGVYVAKQHGRNHVGAIQVQQVQKPKS